MEWKQRNAFLGKRAFRMKTYTDKSTDGSVTLSDYMTADDVYRVPGTSSEYFLIENRKKTSPHDKAGDIGFYFYRMTDALSYPPTVDVLCADGNWNFSINTSTETLTRTTPNPTGKDEMNYRTISGGLEYACYTPVYNENSAWGDNEDAFDLTFNNVLSPVSNPRTTNGASLDFSIEVTGTNTITFYFDGDGTNEYQGSPSKPQYLSVINFRGNPMLTWTANTEPDISSYSIYRKENSSIWTYIGSSTVNSYRDTDVDANAPYDTYYYKVRAKDTQNKYSVYSSEVSIDGLMPKQVAEEIVDESPEKFELIQNYPNPFNPTTSISFSLPKTEYVSLKVYNSLGEEVKELVNGFILEGNYKVIFDGSNLSSGLYFYKIETSEFKEVRKMMLLK